MNLSHHTQGEREEEGVRDRERWGEREVDIERGGRGWFRDRWKGGGEIETQRESENWLSEKALSNIQPGRSSERECERDPENESDGYAPPKAWSPC